MYFPGLPRIFAAVLFATVLPTSLLACERFDDLNRMVLRDDTMVDTMTGLVWKGCLVGQSQQNGKCKGEATELSWLDADALSKKIADERNANWRLPKLEELETVMDAECAGSPFFSIFQFEVTGEIWTASPGFPVNDVAAIVDLKSGAIWGTGKGVSRYIWLVSGVWE